MIISFLIKNNKLKMKSNYDKNLIDYVKDFKVPKRESKYEDKHILLPLHNIVQKEDTKADPNLNSKKKAHKKRKVSSVAKTNTKNPKISKHKHRQNSTEVIFYPELKNQNTINYNAATIEKDIMPSFPKKEKEKKENTIKKKNIDYNKILIKMINQNSLLKQELKKKKDAIDKYKKRYEKQEIMIEDLEAILNELSDNKPFNEQNYEKINTLNNNLEDNILYDEGLQEELALQAVEQQIIDELCPNPDSMTYEQLLQLEDNVGSVSKGLSSNQIDKLPNIKYRKEKNSENYQCIICMEEFEEKEKVKLLPCGHIFHNNCIKQWLLKQKTCPFCKSEIG